MATLTQLKNQIKTLNDFTKVVNIQKIVVLKEIAHWQKIIKQANATQSIFINLVKRLHKKYSNISGEIFEHKNIGRLSAFNRNLHFIFQGTIQDILSEYEFKLIAEHCLKNHNPDDVYVIVGKDLAKHLANIGLKILSVIDSNDMTNVLIYQRISHLIKTGHEDLVYVRATIGFLDVSNRKFFETQVFPFTKKIIEVKKDLDLGHFEPIANLKLGNIVWTPDFTKVVDQLIKNAIESSIHLNIVRYSLTMKLRELQSLDDKEKNIKEEIVNVNLQMQRARKDKITNELLTNATAFQTLQEQEEEQ